jgi:hypothetical protein
MCIIRSVEREEIEKTTDRIIAMYDEVYFDYMNKILDLVRAEANNPQTTQRNLGHLAIESPEIPKTT